MWPVDKEMPVFQALSYWDKWRASGYLRRGQAPTDPRMATAVVELAESYQRQSRAYAALLRWWPVVMVVSLGYLTISAAIDGDQVGLMLRGLTFLGAVGIAVLDPAIRPKNMARSLEASRRVTAASG